jgi:hypothetical protein
MDTSVNRIVWRMSALPIFAIPAYCPGMRLGMHPDNGIFRSAKIKVKKQCMTQYSCAFPAIFVPEGAWILRHAVPIGSQ